MPFALLVISWDAGDTKLGGINFDELENKKDYNNFLNDTNRSDVMTRPVWELMSKLPMYSHCQRDSQKNAIKLKDRIINIPSGVI